jgi:hypothetical protein
MFTVHLILSLVALAAIGALYVLAGGLEATARRHGNRIQSPSALWSYERGRLVLYWLLGRPPHPAVPLFGRVVVWIARGIILATCLFNIFSRYFVD